MSASTTSHPSSSGLGAVASGLGAVASAFSSVASAVLTIRTPLMPATLLRLKSSIALEIVVATLLHSSLTERHAFTKMSFILRDPPSLAAERFMPLRAGEEYLVS